MAGQGGAGNGAVPDPLNRRPFSGLDHDPWGPIDTIKGLLADVYRADADGLTIVRELVQNADDAKARLLAFTVVHRGLRDADNTLLHGPALVVINDGPFLEQDHDGLHRAIGGAKREDASKVGRFGLGLKSTFHLCEAFLYLGFNEAIPRVGALNPWAGTGSEPGGFSDPLHPDWDEVTDADYRRMLQVGRRILPDLASKGLLLWIPLRLTSHVDRGANGSKTYGISDRCHQPERLRDWFASGDSLSLLLAQCRHLTRVVVGEMPDASVVEAPELLLEIGRNGGDQTWLDRPP